MADAGRKVLFHRGESVGLKTRADKGRAWVDATGLHVEGPDGAFVIRAEDLREVELFRQHGLGRMVRVDHAGGRLFISVVRFMVWQLALIDFFGTGALHAALAAHLPARRRA